MYLDCSLGSRICESVALDHDLMHINYSCFSFSLVMLYTSCTKWVIALHYWYHLIELLLTMRNTTPILYKFVQGGCGRNVITLDQ